MSFPNHAPDVARYGTWSSHLSAADIATGGVRLIDLAVDGSTLVWLESRPAEAGRCVLVRRQRDGRCADLTPAGFNVRSRVHEYGGQSFLLDQGTIWFANDADQRVYRQVGDEAPHALTSAAPMRYAGFVHDRRRDRLVCVREDHSGDGEPINALVAIDTRTGQTRELWQGSDFVDAPALSPDGRHLAWIAWNHPDMPWDTTRLWLAQIADDGGLRDARCLNPDRDESVLEPRWSDAGHLHCLSDRGGWWNLHHWQGGDLHAMHRNDAEFALAPWQISQGNYRLRKAPGLARGASGEPAAAGHADQALLRWLDLGVARLGLLDLAATPGCADPAVDNLQPFELPYTGIESLCLSADGGTAWFLGAAAGHGPALIELDLASGTHRRLHAPDAPDLAPNEIAQARPFTFCSSGDETAHAFFYAPTNARWRGPDDEKPPAIVVIHGGPTAQTSPCFKPALQFWTQRGFAVIDVDYRGSSGYGRDYRHRLRGQWGVLDVEDAIHAARHAVAAGWVDGQRLIIRGGSAGGYTVLAALARHDVFAAGANYYGVSDVESLARDTHKFESRYLDRLIGPYPAERERYRERSPIHHLDGFDRPLIVFQGLEDKIVPPSQSEAIVDALKARGVAVAYVPFAGEQHGFRRSENQVRALEAELYFYGRVFGFEPADRIEPVPIDNLCSHPSLPA